MLKIENGIPAPGDTWKQKSEERLALESMEIGDSFAFEQHRKGRVLAAAATVAMRDRETGGSKRFQVRGLRAWRIE